MSSLRLTDGAVDLDMEEKPIEVLLKGFSVFSGTVETARSQGSRGGGRLVPVTAKGFNTCGPAKEAQAFHLDDATLADFLNEAAASGPDIRCRSVDRQHQARLLGR